jgi:hypothetical protein
MFNLHDFEFPAVDFVEWYIREAIGVYSRSLSTLQYHHLLEKLPCPLSLTIH